MASFGLIFQPVVALSPRHYSQQNHMIEIANVYGPSCHVHFCDFSDFLRLLRVRKLLLHPKHVQIVRLNRPLFRGLV